MKIILIYILTFILLACGTYTIISEDEIHLAPYAIQHKDYNCDALLNRVEDKNFAISFLYKSFGDSTACLERVFATNRLKAIEAHFFNSWCILRGVCHRDTELFTADIRYFEKLLIKKEGWLLERLSNRLKELNTLLNKTDADCFVSTGLETDVSVKASDVIVDLIKEHVPRCKTVFNPIYFTTDRGKADYIEIHGNEPQLTPPCLANLDGIDARDIDVERYLRDYAHCDYQFLWTTDDNCGGATADFVHPHLRECS